MDIEELKEFVISKVEEELREGKRDVGHDKKHVLTVYAYAKKLCDKEGGDWSVLGPAALLHDVERPNEDYLKKKYKHEELSAQTAEEMGYNERVVNAIRRHSCGKGCPKPKVLEDRLLWDADKLDAFGPQGLARWFVIMGQNNYSMVDAAKYYITTTEELGLKPCDFGSDDSILDAWFYTQTAKSIARPQLAYTREFIRKVLE